MLGRAINGMMLVAVVVATVAGYTRLEPVRAGTPAPDRAAQVEMAARPAGSCDDEPPARRRPPAEPEGCVDPTALAAR